MPHVSWVTDIAELFGTSSVPVIVGGSVLGVFELGERLASQRAKDALSKWLLSFDVQKARALPDGTQELFERIFGERHFSLKCFIRSAAFSLGAMAFLFVLAFLIDPNEALQMADRFFYHGLWILLTIWLTWSVLIDYISLFKTRVILRFLYAHALKSPIMALIILGIDLIVYRLIFLVGIAVSTLAFEAMGLKWGFDIRSNYNS
jgi:hypothetical protein